MVISLAINQNESIARRRARENHYSVEILEGIANDFVIIHDLANPTKPHFMIEQTAWEGLLEEYNELLLENEN